jgi:hypothetical protein
MMPGLKIANVLLFVSFTTSAIGQQVGSGEDQSNVISSSPVEIPPDVIRSSPVEIPPNVVHSSPVPEVDAPTPTIADATANPRAFLVIGDPDTLEKIDRLADLLGMPAGEGRRIDALRWAVKEATKDNATRSRAQSRQRLAR